MHTTPPPELQLPPGPDLMTMRADFNGVTLDLNRWAHLGSIPFLAGANSTPLNMLMSPMLPMYPRPWQDAYLTEYCERYTHIVVAHAGWNMAANGFAFTPQTFAEWCRTLRQSWGLYVVDWHPDRPEPEDPYLAAALDAHAVDWYIVGKEVDAFMTAQQFAAVLDAIMAHDYGLPIGVHFTANYPLRFPRDTFLDGRSMYGWGKYNGKIHLMWQALQTDTAGTQGACLYYARERVNLGMVSPDGGFADPAPDSLVYAFEPMASAQLYGRCTEEYGCLRTLELMYTTRGDVRIRPMAGYDNGGRLPNGDPL